jgi:hypothetical protein
MLPQTADNFFLQAFDVWIAFQRDAAGKVVGFMSADGGPDFEARRQVQARFIATRVTPASAGSRSASPTDAAGPTAAAHGLR